MTASGSDRRLGPNPTSQAPPRNTDPGHSPSGAPTMTHRHSSTDDAEDVDADVLDAEQGDIAVTGGPRVAGRRGWVLLTVLTVVFAMVVGYLAGLLTPSLRTPGDTSPEAGFARDMSTHHAQAVEMAMIAWQKVTDPEVKKLAYDIATGQQAQIGVMST